LSRRARTEAAGFRPFMAYIPVRHPSGSFAVQNIHPDVLS
jgi:hypothetical protein